MFRYGLTKDILSKGQNHTSAGGGGRAANFRVKTVNQNNANSFDGSTLENFNFKLISDKKF